MNNTFKSCTLVTAYYEIDIKKSSSQQYYEWMHNFLTNADTYMVIFTDEKSKELIANFRQKHIDKTYIIILPIDQFYTYRYIEHWKKDLERDHEKVRNHSAELYMIWNEKSMFVKHAIDINPFDTEYFCWSDIGMIRKPQYGQFINEYPKVRDDIDKNKIYLLNIMYQFNEDDFNFKELATERYRHLNAIGGGVIYGHIDVFLLWIEKYYEMLEEFVRQDLFAGKDQSLMACVYVKNRDIIQLIVPQQCVFNGPSEDWFYLVCYFS